MSQLAESTAIVPRMAEATRKAAGYAANGQAAHTRQAYRSDWQDFVAWCQIHGQAALPATGDTVAGYLADRADTLKASTLQRRLSSIAAAHRAAGLDTPTTAPAVRLTWNGIRRTKPTAQHGKAPLLLADLRSMLATVPPGLKGIRDRALLLVGFAGAFRRSELVALDVADVSHQLEGVVLTIRRSKTDQEAVGRSVGIPRGRHAETDAVAALVAWLEASHITEGALWRPINRHGQLATARITDKAVARIVQHYAAAAGLDPTLFAGHSLRAGLATSAAANGASERCIMATTGHKSDAMVRRYIREASLFRSNAASEAGM